jgi:DNA-binding MarR family transcriptional regulator
MPLNSPDTTPQQERIILELLESVERESQQTQRDLAQEFGVALGMVNAYLKFCIKKGHVRVKKIPSKRYLYFLTPQGFAEKSRLSLKLMSNSLVSFRKARQDYDSAFVRLKASGHNKVVLVGQSELSEIAILCALNAGIVPVAVVDPEATPGSFANVPVVNSFEDVCEIDGAVLTDLRQPQLSYREAVARLGAANVVAPSILGVLREFQ